MPRNRCQGEPELGCEQSSHLRTAPAERRERAGGSAELDGEGSGAQLLEALSGVDERVRPARRP